MKEYDASTYGECIAGVYDEWYTSYDEMMVATLRDLARGGRVLELGIGTGRVALPLSRQGVAIAGLDASPAMVARLHARPGGEQIPVTIGDFADMAVEGRFTLVFVVFNTFFALPTQDAQVRCFQNVAQHLEPGGKFVIEAFVPNMNRYSDGQTLRISKMAVGELRLEASRIDPLRQEITSQQIVLSEQGTHLYPVQLRYAWPAELDLMARLAGLQLAHRWGTWYRSPLGAENTKHISVYTSAA